MGNADDYNIYHMTCKDYIIGYLIGFVPGFVIIMIFFRIMVFSAIVGGFCGIPAIHLYRKYRKEKRKRDLLIEFRDLLEALTTSYSSGKNTMEAFAESYQDLLSLYGEKSDIVNETRIIIAGMTNNIIIEDLLKDFAKRCGLDDVESFASTFESGLRQGGDIKQVVWDSRKIINDKIEIEMEIKTMLTEKENEVIEATKEEIKEAIKEADKQPKQKVSFFLETMFEEPTNVIKEQIEHFKAKENK